jgi:hypothetical protein
VTDTIRNEIKVDKTALSYWFPKLVEAGIPVPRTKIITMPPEAQKVMWKWFDDQHCTDQEQAAYNDFFGELCALFIDRHRLWQCSVACCRRS